MKVAPLLRAMNRFNEEQGVFFESMLVHTGQHYDHEMSSLFFQDLNLPAPDIHLGVGSGSHAEQTGKVLIEFEKILNAEHPDVIIVVGDVNSTLAAALAAAKLCIPVAHVEAGLRSFDRNMPEEINRLLTDAISDYLFTPSYDADENLKREGIPPDKIFLVGDVMVDSLLYNLHKSRQSGIISQLGLEDGHYALLTLHRPGNVDDRDILIRIMKSLSVISERIPVVFPVHPRTRKRMGELELLSWFPNGEGGGDRRIVMIDPLGYLDFLRLMAGANFVMTDSGGIQEETTVLGIPCLTLRNTTERPITISHGTNTLVGSDPAIVVAEAFKILDDSVGKNGSRPDLWDGRAADRIIEILGRELMR